MDRTVKAYSKCLVVYRLMNEQVTAPVLNFAPVFLGKENIRGCRERQNWRTRPRLHKSGSRMDARPRVLTCMLIRNLLWFDCVMSPHRFFLCLNI